MGAIKVDSPWKDSPVIDALTKATGSLEILVRLYKNGATGKTELSRDLQPCYETVAKTLEKLQKMGLIVASNETKFPFRQVYMLTESGRMLVETPLLKWPEIERQISPDEIPGRIAEGKGTEHIRV